MCICYKSEIARCPLTSTFQSFLSVRPFSARGSVLRANALEPAPFPVAPYRLRLILSRLGCTPGSASAMTGASFGSFSRSDAVRFLLSRSESSLAAEGDVSACDALFSPMRERRLPGPVGGAFQSRSLVGPSDLPLRGPSLAIARGADGVDGGKDFPVAGTSGVRFSIDLSSPSLSLRRRSGSLRSSADRLLSS